MRFIRSFISNLTSLLLALVVAVAIWATAVRASDPIETRILEVSVDIVGIPADGSLVGRPPGSVFITVQGPTSALDEIVPEDYSGVIDLSDVPFGDSEVEILIQGERERVEVLSTRPETASIRMEQIVTREIPIVLDVRGEVARGHRLGETRVEPQAFQVTGPAPRVDQLTEGRVTIFVDNAREDISDLRRPIFYDAEGNVASVVGLTLSPNEVEAIIPVVELAGFAEKPITVNWVGEPAQGYRLLDVRVEPSSVQVTGSPAQLAVLRVQTEQIDITGLSESESLQVALDLPEGVTPVDIQPFIVTVEIEPILSSDVVQRPVEVSGLGEELEAILDPEDVRVFLFGPLPVLDSLAEDDVRVTVDLFTLELGTHIVSPIVSVSANDVVVRSTQPAVVTVVLTNAITITNGLTETVPVTPTSLLPSPETSAGESVVSQSGFDHSGDFAASISQRFAILSRKSVLK